MPGAGFTAHSAGRLGVLFLSGPHRAILKTTLAISGAKWIYVLIAKTNRRMARMAKARKGYPREQDFTLVLTGINEISPEAENALFEAGCDDATLSSRCGGVYLTFSRTAGTLKDAILSAIQDVRKARIG